MAPVPPGNRINVSGASRCTPLGNPPGSGGYKCGRDFLFKPNLLRAKYRFDELDTYGPGGVRPYTNDVAILVTLYGPSDTKRYCARFPIGSAVRNNLRVFKARNAPAPTACSPSGAFLDASDTL
jgi:hypothetical protein